MFPTRLTRPRTAARLCGKGLGLVAGSAAAILLGAGGGAWAAPLPAGVGLRNPTLAYGLTGISDWSPEMPFLNIVHMMRPWIGHSRAKWNAMTTQQLEEGGYLDAKGWPKRMPPGLDAIGTIWAWGGKDLAGSQAAKSRAGTYVLTYKGEGSIRLKLGSVQVIQSRPGRIIFRNPTGTQMALDITATDPKGTGDYIRDIAIVPERYEGLYQAGEIFNPDWLKIVNDARELRFMDWMETNGSAVENWSQRPTPGDATWMDKGVPVEVMVQLANQTGAEPWFDMPAKASDAYIRDFATYVRDHLDPDLVAHVEYSNEVWNWAFSQTRWLIAQAKAKWGETGGGARANYAAKRATETALIWDKVFGDQARKRVDNVMGVQNGNLWQAEQELTAPLWKKHEPGAFVAPTSVFTSIAATTYFGGSVVADAKLRAELLDRIKSRPPAEVGRWLTSKLSDPSYASSIPQIEARWLALKKIADRYKLRLVAYEGGQHVQQAFAVRGLSKDELAALTRFLTGYIRSPDMAMLYDALWQAWAKVGDGPFMQYTDVGAPSKWGSWGLFAALGDTNPRAEQLMRLNQSSKAWFGDGGGVRYQQGVIRIAGPTGERLTGTGKQDFLIGGPGNDILVPGTGKDGLNGGGGTDTVVLSGKPDQYRLVPEGAGFLLTGPGVSDYVVNVERFAFDGGVTRTLAEMRGR